MGILKKFDPILYPIKLCVMCQPDYYKESELYVHTDNKMIYPDEDMNPASTSPIVVEKETGLFTVVVVFKTPLEDTSVQTIAHEAVHAANRMMEHISENVSGEESFAYLVGWVAGCIDETIEEYKTTDEYNLENKENE